MLEDTTFVLGFECAGPKFGDAIIAMNVVVVDTKDSFRCLEGDDWKIQFAKKNYDEKWLINETRYDEDAWHHAISPKEAYFKLKAFLDRNSTRKRKSRNGDDYTVWRFAFWDNYSERFFIEWTKKLGVEFVPIDHGKSLFVKDRLAWYFAENPHMTEPNKFTIEDMVKYFNINVPLIGGRITGCVDKTAAMVDLIKKTAFCV